MRNVVRLIASISAHVFLISESVCVCSARVCAVYIVCVSYVCECVLWVCCRVHFLSMYHVYVLCLYVMLHVLHV